MTDLEIVAHLDGVFENFLRLIPENLRKQAQRDIFVAGGAVVNLVRGDIPFDYDFFIKTEDTRNALRAWFEIGGPEVVARTENAITLKVGDNQDAVQLVTRFFGPVERVFRDFDFEHCKSYYDFATGKLHYDREIILNKRLIYTGEKDQFTLNTLKRLTKFIKRGWQTDHDSLINLHRAIQNRPHIDQPAERKIQVIGYYGSSWE